MDYGFQKVIAWQKAHEFVLYVYRVTNGFPENERFALLSQFRRAAISIEANIAEGYKKLSKADKLRFLILPKAVWRNAEIVLSFPVILNISVSRNIIG